MSWTAKSKGKKLSKKSTKKVSSKVVKTSDVFKPEKYQTKVIKFCYDRYTAGIFLDPGMGKSAILLSIFLKLVKNEYAEKMVIVAPNIVCDTTWNYESEESEIQKWKQFRHFKCIKLHGPKKDQLIYEDADIYIVTSDGVKWLSEMLKKDKSLRSKFDVLGIDESTKFKNHKTTTPNKKETRFGAAKYLSDYFEFRYIMTGTPSSNSLEHLFSQIYILDHGRSLGRYITQFRNQYFIQGKDFWQRFPKPDAEKLIFERLKDLVIRMDRDDYIDMPPIKYINKVFDLPEKIRKMYDDMENELIAEIENETVVAKTIGVATGKLRQIANGGLYMKKGSQDPKVLHMLKAELAYELVEELNGKPAIVVFEFEHDLERLLKQFGKNTPYIAGGGKKSDKVEVIQRKWNRGEIPVLLAQMTSISHGVNLQHGGRAIIWHSNTYDLEVYIQLRDRIWRRGQENMVYIFHLMAKDTVDLMMLLSRKRKKNSQDALFQEFRNYIKTKRKLT